jgi:hypothetical protein
MLALGPNGSDGMTLDELRPDQSKGKARKVAILVAPDALASTINESPKGTIAGRTYG